MREWLQDAWGLQDAALAHRRFVEDASRLFSTSSDSFERICSPLGDTKDATFETSMVDGADDDATKNMLLVS